MHSRRSTLALGALLLAALSCTEQEISTAPDSHRPSPELEIRDGAHGGNAHFFFLPPLLPNPRTSGIPDASLAPSLAVEICDLGTARPPATESCGPTPVVIARFTSRSGIDNEVVRYDGTAKRYAVNWHTDRTPLLINHFYRLRVLAAGTELGQADIDPVKTAKDLRNYDTGDAIQLVDGRTLPIQFRVEAGAVGVVTPGTAPQTVSVPSTVAGQAVVVTVAGGTEVNGGTAAVGLTVEPVTLPSPQALGAIGSTAYEFGPDGTTFSQPVTLTVPYDPTALAGVPQAKLRLYRVESGPTLSLLDGGVVNLQTHTVSGLTEHFSVYVVAEQVAAVEVVQATASLDIGQTAALDVTVDQPGRIVGWSSSDAAVATVDENGVVTAVTAGAAVVTATSEGQSDQASVTVRAPIVADYALQVTSLGSLPEGYSVDRVAINPRHTVVLGSARFATGERDRDGEPIERVRMFAWTPALGLRLLDGEYESGTLSDANTERASGYVFNDGEPRQMVWDLASGAVLYSVAGFGGSINDANYAVGVCGVAECGDNPTIRDPEGNLVHVLPAATSGAVIVARIGEHQEVVGTADVGAGMHTVLWTPAAPTLRDLTPDIAFSAAVGINFAGAVTGHFSDAATGRQGAFVWSAADGPELLPNPFGTAVAPGTISDEGVVYGQTIDPGDPFRRIIVWVKESGTWVAKVSEKLPANAEIANTNNLGQTAGLNVETGEIELLTLVP